MRRVFLLTLIFMTGAMAVSTPPNDTAEVSRLKSDLIGQTMGGREGCWKFRSPDQIKELTIKDKTEAAQQRIYTIALQLQAKESGAKYTADARVTYAKTREAWKIQSVGLLSLKKMP